jgi:hypothetical protein
MQLFEVGGVAAVPSYVVVHRFEILINRFEISKVSAKHLLHLPYPVSSSPLKGIKILVYPVSSLS